MEFLSAAHFIFLWCFSHEILHGIRTTLTIIDQSVHCVSRWLDWFVSWIHIGMGKGKMNESIWDLSNYAFSWLMMMVLHPVFITLLCMYLIWKCPSLVVSMMPRKMEDDIDNASVTEPPSGDESSGYMAYQVLYI